MSGATANALDLNQYFNLLTGTMTDQPVTVSNRIRAQSTGANAGTGGYVGQTSSGAPTSGSFNVGDHVIDSTGALYVCTAAGSPGTWRGSGATLLGSTTTSSLVSSFTFSSLPQNYAHLMIIHTGQSDQGSDQLLYLEANGDSTLTNYSYSTIQGTGSSVLPTSSNVPRIGTVATAGHSLKILLHRYSSASAEDGFKKAESQGTRGNNPPNVELFAWNWKPSSSTAITRVDLLASTGNFSIGSSTSIYGLPG